MREGGFPDGAHVLRAKIDMASPNINLRDPVLYRIKRPRTTAPATPGRSTRCTPMPTRSRTRSSA
jgi:glutamyl/glutaminyl-tRNA synthetase